MKEQQAESVEAQPLKRRVEIRMVSEETQGYVVERRRCDDPGREKVVRSSAVCQVL